MKDYYERLYEDEKTEWNNIKAYLQSEGYRSKNGKKQTVDLNPFKSIEHLHPISIHEVWDIKHGDFKVKSICLDYTYRMQEEVGDGQVSLSSDRIEEYSSSSFWFYIKLNKSIPKMIISPVTGMKIVGQLLSKKRFGGNMAFNLKYIIDPISDYRSKKFVDADIQKIFTSHRKICFESVGDKVLIRDNKALKFKSFKEKISFARQFMSFM